MNEQLQSELTELADGLGIGVGELWSWLSGHGVDAYASVQVSTLTAQCVALGLVELALVASVAWLVHMHRKTSKKEGAWWYDGEYAVATVVPSFAFVLLLIPLIDDAVTLAGWLTSPEGMVIRMLVERG